MKLFNILEGALTAYDRLPNQQELCDYSENGCSYILSDAEADKILEVGKKWVAERENGNGEWSRMRHEAISALECE